MKPLIAGLSILVVFGVLLDAFETVVLPRRVTRRIRFARFFYRITWIPSAALARRIRARRRRDSFLGFFGPLSLIMLLSAWAGGLVLGFAALHWSIESPLNASAAPHAFGTYVYMSGTTFFTLGYGDITPTAPVGRAIAVLEAGVGFGFLALIIGYLPVIYQAFSRRESNISLLDARAGSPPSAAELLRRHGHNIQELDQLLRDWERWAADILESHLSYPVLCYYRSQHNNQSWLTALTAVLDASALVIVGIDGASRRQAQLTFAIARHAVVDLAQIFNTAPSDLTVDRLPSDELDRLRAVLGAEGVRLETGAQAEQLLSELRAMYEPFVSTLADFLFFELPPWVPTAEAYDNWQTSRWGRISRLAQQEHPAEQEEHF
ncbi:MAG TPA: potassium channel family protein [Blastocatellia bacterium]|nr:potassium channel family protein [Blastocatellia bacterium]